MDLILLVITWGVFSVVGYVLGKNDGYNIGYLDGYDARDDEEQLKRELDNE